MALWVARGTEAMAGPAAEDFSGPGMFNRAPDAGTEMDLGQIGATGIQARIYRGLKVTVEGTEPGTPAAGRFEKGEVILGVNGTTLEGKNPLVVLGAALTEAEAGDGVLTFEVSSPDDEATREVTVRIPVLGAYSPTFPLDCRKSDAIVRRAADFYARPDRLKEHHLLNAYACLFLLSTGDDRYVPRVREYFAQFLNEDGTAKNVGDNSWHNGPNGVACAEYYLRTGDRSVLPLLQHYVDDARDRQRYGVGWGHWGAAANPAYEAGGGMQHAAGTPILLTLLLGKVCGVDVDEDTLIGALRHWYRFVGHGGSPVADQRYWLDFYCCGRDGWTAAVMNVATRSRGDVTIYREARALLTRQAITTWTYSFWDLWGQWIAGGFAPDVDAGLYHRTMRRAGWLFDLGRQASGGFWVQPGHHSLEGMGSGVVLALAYTAPRKTLQITGAPPSPHAVEFSLPARLWGNEADLAFLDARHHPDFHRYGEEEEFYVPFRRTPLPHGLRYAPDQFRDVPLEALRKYVRHYHYVIRAGAAKVMAMNGHVEELEQLLNDPDPRLRRAALDGINDCRPWFEGSPVFRYPLPPEEFTPAMNAAITRMLADPDEAWFVVEGALMALYHAPVELIEQNVPRILAWRDHEEWWLRDAAFHALMGFRDNEELFVRHLPHLIDILINEYPYNPRVRMNNLLVESLRKAEPGSEVHRMIAAGLSRAVRESEVLPDIRRYNRSKDGLTNIREALQAGLENVPELAPEMAGSIVAAGLLPRMDDGNLMEVTGRLLESLDRAPGPEKQRLADILFDVYRPELASRFDSVASDRGRMNRAINQLLHLARLKEDVTGWQPLGAPAPAERVWRYRSFDPMTEEERLHPRIPPPNRLREVTLSTDMQGWQQPDYDDGGWNSGKAPIGTGLFKPHGHSHAPRDFFFQNNSDWGSGEFLAMRTTFELTGEDLAKDFYRIRILTPQGFHLYLNGQRIHSYFWFYNTPEYNEIILDARHVRHFQPGRNTLAVHGLVRYEQDRQTGEYSPIGQMDVFFEALDKKDLGL